MLIIILLFWRNWLKNIGRHHVCTEQHQGQRLELQPTIIFITDYSADYFFDQHNNLSTIVTVYTAFTLVYKYFHFGSSHRFSLLLHHICISVFTYRLFLSAVDSEVIVEPFITFHMHIQHRGRSSFPVFYLCLTQRFSEWPFTQQNIYTLHESIHTFIMLYSTHRMYTVYISRLIFFFLTGEPKIGVYMLNSGGKKLYVKVRSFFCFVFLLVL